MTTTIGTRAKAAANGWLLVIESKIEVPMNCSLETSFGAR